RVVDHRRTELSGEPSAVPIGGHDAHRPDRDGGGEHVPEHGERELAPCPARGVQPRLALDARERNDDRRHGQRLARGMTNTEIAQTLDAYAALLDLSGAGHYAVRAYRRAADLVRETLVPVEDLVRAGRARELRGIGPGIGRRLTELVSTGRLLELEELEREVEPQLVALG